eukprot:TRINITY_DN7074_c0_g1_i1.p1 TRINITY_DN7074_c0_g1~~TRINITY_DN7074_c0_g1_i1.p1  ORF type:complete len:781 (+),score=213.97 TRINITY_DN7074_c0_g1_i1:120-2345(+)
MASHSVEVVCASSLEEEALRASLKEIRTSYWRLRAAISAESQREGAEGGGGEEEEDEEAANGESEGAFLVRYIELTANLLTEQVVSHALAAASPESADPPSATPTKSALDEVLSLLTNPSASPFLEADKVLKQQQKEKEQQQEKEQEQEKQQQEQQEVPPLDTQAAATIESSTSTSTLTPPLSPADHPSATTEDVANYIDSLMTADDTEDTTSSTSPSTSSKSPPAIDTTRAHSPRSSRDNLFSHHRSGSSSTPPHSPSSTTRRSMGTPGVASSTRLAPTPEATAVGNDWKKTGGFGRSRSHSRNSPSVVITARGHKKGKRNNKNRHSSALVATRHRGKGTSVSVPTTPTRAFADSLQITPPKKAPASSHNTPAQKVSTFSTVPPHAAAYIQAEFEALMAEQASTIKQLLEDAKENEANPAKSSGVVDRLSKLNNFSPEQRIISIGEKSESLVELKKQVPAPKPLDYTGASAHLRMSLHSVLIDPEGTAEFRRYVEAKSAVTAKWMGQHIMLYSELLATKRKTNTSDIAKSCQKIAARYIGDDGEEKIKVDKHNLESFRKLTALFGATTPGVFDDISEEICNGLLPFWQEYLVNPTLPDSDNNGGGDEEKDGKTLPTPNHRAHSRTDSASQGASPSNPKSLSAFSKTLFKGKKKQKKKKGESSDHFDEVVVDIVRENSVIEEGPCGHCKENISISAGGVQFGVRLYHKEHLFCRVCSRAVDPDFALSQDKSHNQPICADCS